MQFQIILQGCFVLILLVALRGLTTQPVINLKSSTIPQQLEDATLLEQQAQSVRKIAIQERLHAETSRILASDKKKDAQKARENVTYWQREKDETKMKEYEAQVRLHETEAAEYLENAQKYDNEAKQHENQANGKEAEAARIRAALTTKANTPSPTTNNSSGNSGTTSISPSQNNFQKCSLSYTETLPDETEKKPNEQNPPKRKSTGIAPIVEDIAEQTKKVKVDGGDSSNSPAKTTNAKLQIELKPKLIEDPPLPPRVTLELTTPQWSIDSTMRPEPKALCEADKGDVLSKLSAWSRQLTKQESIQIRCGTLTIPVVSPFENLRKLSKPQVSVTIGNSDEKRKSKAAEWNDAVKAQQEAFDAQNDFNALQKRFEELDEMIRIWKGKHKSKDSGLEPNVPNSVLVEIGKVLSRRDQAAQMANQLKQIAQVKLNTSAPLIGQTGPNTCTLTCIRMVLLSLTGQELTDKEVANESSKYPFPWTPKGGNTRNLPKILEAFCLKKANLKENQTIENLASATANGPVIVHVTIPGSTVHHVVVVDQVRPNPDGSLTILGRDPLPVGQGSRFEMSQSQFVENYQFKGQFIQVN